jgi:predicted  nucleic acid-binding Zn-ribbon protein
MSTPTQIEKENLEAHVEICAVRYGNLETKLSNLEQRIDKLEVHLISIKDALTSKVEGQDKQTINTFVTIGGVILAALLGFITHGLFK